LAPFQRINPKEELEPNAATAERPHFGPGEVYIEGRFGIEITPLYIPLFRATLQFQQNRPVSATSNEVASLLKTAS
jgi:hypothetical protein